MAALAAAAALFAALALLPALAPENVFRATQSRLQIPVDVLFARLAALRPGGRLTARDAALRARFASLESRLLYLQFGPAVLADCPFCSSGGGGGGGGGADDDPRAYLYYALPDLVAPHLLNLVLIAAATSPLLLNSTSTGASWRTPATLAAVGLALADVYLVATYNHTANARALRLAEVEPFYWVARGWRYAGLAVLDAGLAGLMYLTGTQRAFVGPPAPAERVEAAARALALTKGKVNAAGVVKNTVLRDEELRGRSTAYWAHEGRLVREMMEEREVVEAVNDALKNRIDIRSIESEAEAYAKAVLMPGGMGRTGAREEVVG